jgi:ABC-type branched-subunit amino acid transport system ATPase component
MSASLLAIEDLAVSYGGVVAVNGIDLAVGERQAVALLGANGAGKSPGASSSMARISRGLP